MSYRSPLVSPPPPPRLTPFPLPLYVSTDDKEILCATKANTLKLMLSFLKIFLLVSLISPFLYVKLSVAECVETH